MSWSGVIIKWKFAKFLHKVLYLQRQLLKWKQDTFQYHIKHCLDSNPRENEKKIRINKEFFSSVVWLKIQKNLNISYSPIHTWYLSRTPRIYSCQFFLAGVNFFRFNAKIWQFTVYFAVITQKIDNLLCICRNLRIFSV